jgi:hypothetical protein
MSANLKRPLTKIVSFFNQKKEEEENSPFLPIHKQNTVNF